MTNLFLLWWALVVAASYAPVTNQKCPSVSSFLRPGNSTSDLEKQWLDKRHENTKQALETFLKKVGLEEEIPKDVVISGVALSGGGYRAMLAGGGNVAALDSRTPSPLGGVLDLSSYILALSGGSWALGSLLAYDWQPMDKVYKNWHVDEKNGLISPSVNWIKLGWSVLTNNLQGALTQLNHWSSIDGQILAKEKAGFEVTLTDYWGRGLAYQMTPSNGSGGAFDDSLTLSDIRDSQPFSNHKMPFPLLIALGRKPGTTTYNLNSTVVEMNPFEIGSFDTSLNSFSDIRYLGTNVSNGKPTNSCTTGFDNLGFIVGTSSSLFNQYLNTLFCDDCDLLNPILKWVGKKFLTYLSNGYEDLALYKPNPFYHSEYANSENITTNDTLYLFDGGLGGEVIPLSSLMTKERKLDIAFAFDNSGNLDNNYPDGESLISTYQRQFSSQGKLTLCPYVPPASTFLSENFTAKPVFFGCDGKNLTDLAKDGVVPPLVIYFANRPFNTWSNTSLNQLTYSDLERDDMIRNGFSVATRVNSTLDDEWATCVGCAMIRRSQERNAIEQLDKCKKCFDRYCWDGTVVDNAPILVNFTDDGLTNATMMPLINQPNFIKRLIERANSALAASISPMILAVLAASWIL